ncbi:type II secretion system protein N [Pseudomonas sp. LRF_L74]|uniref:type II secretion system protein N n=1 Tax=Pseudomonas sp. LRF_L74 TaxID=3369422 RepID=UPI003F5E1904
MLVPQYKLKKLKSILKQLPLQLSAVFALIMIISLYKQTAEWRDLLTPKDIAIDAEEQKERKEINLELITKLFPPPQPKPLSPRNTQLPIKLLGSIIHSDPLKSVAIIGSNPTKSGRYHVGDMISEGVIIRKISSYQVELERNGNIEYLSFPSKYKIFTPPQSLLTLTPSKTVLSNPDNKKVISLFKELKSQRSLGDAPSE